MTIPILFLITVIVLVFSGMISFNTATYLLVMASGILLILSRR